MASINLLFAELIDMDVKSNFCENEIAQCSEGRAGGDLPHVHRCPPFFLIETEKLARVE